MSKSGELDELLTLDEASKVLKCHKNTLRLWDKKGILRAIRIGERGLRYKKEDIQQLLNNGSTLPKDDGLDEERQRIYELFMQAPIPIAILRGPRHVYEFSNPLTNKVLQVKNPIGKSIKELFPDNKEILKLLDTTYKTGKAFDAKEYPIKLDTPGKKSEIIYVNATYQPLRGKNNQVEGIMTTGVDVTEQVVARKRIEESEEHFRALVNATSDVVYRMNPDWSEMCELHGRKFLADTGKPSRTWLKKYIPAEEQPYVMKAIKESIRTKKIFQLEHRVKQADGSIGWMFSRAVPILDDKGNISEWFGAASDITSRKKIEESLQKQLQLIATITNNATTGLFIMDDKQHCTFMNPAAEKITGLTFKEVQKANKPLHYIIHHTKPDGKRYPMRECPIDRALPEKANTQGEDIFIRPDGSFYPVAFMASPIKEDGKLTGTVIEVRDTTIEKQRDEALKQSELRYRRLVDANIVGVIIADFKGHILDANDAFLHMVGATKFDLQQNKVRWDTLTPLEFRHVDKQISEDLKRYGKSEPKEKAFFHKNGSQIPVVVACASIGKKNGTAIALILDISVRKKLERQKDEFLGIASHELKTPVTSIKAYAQVLYKMFSKKGDTRSADMLGKMDAQINKLTVLISDLLDVTKIESGKLQLNLTNFDFNELVSEVVEEVQRTTLNHKIKTDLAKSKIVYGDRERTGQVITNYLTNAIKYSPDSESIIVRTQINKSEIILSVEDFGLGIPKKMKDKVFERFYRVQGDNKDTFPGLGLGLYISREIIERQKGRVWVESQENKGATFYFCLPIKKER